MLCASQLDVNFDGFMWYMMSYGDEFTSIGQFTHIPLRSISRASVLDAAYPQDFEGETPIPNKTRFVDRIFDCSTAIVQAS